MSAVSVLKRIENVHLPRNEGEQLKKNFIDFLKQNFDKTNQNRIEIHDFHQIFDGENSIFFF